MNALRPTGIVSPDRTQIEVTDPDSIATDAKPYMVTVPQYMASADPKYLATHPWEGTSKPYPQNTPAYGFGVGLRNKLYDITSTDTGASLLSGALGAGGGLAGSYLWDALGGKLWGKRPMGTTGRVLSALAGTLLAAGGQRYLSNSINGSLTGKSAAFKVSSSMAEYDRLQQIKQQMAAQLMSSNLPLDVKSRILMALQSMAGNDLMSLAQFIAPFGGAAAGAAMAKFIFGDSFLPKLLGGLMGGYMTASSMTPKLNAIGEPMY